MIMEINWNAVLTGFVVALVLAIVLAFIVPLTSSSIWLLAVPGLIGGLVAGYMVMGGWEGAVHGGLATIFGGLMWLVVITFWGVFFVGLIPALTGATIILGALFFQAIPGAISGAIGGWLNERREMRPGTPTS